MLCVIGVLGLWVGDAWLVPSLGSAIFVQTPTPSELAAELAAFACVYAVGAGSLPSFTSGQPLDAARLVAVALSIVATVPPTLHGAALLAAGILLVTALGEPVRTLLPRSERKAG